MFSNVLFLCIKCVLIYVCITSFSNANIESNTNFWLCRKIYEINYNFSEKNILKSISLKWVVDHLFIALISQNGNVLFH